LLFRTFQCHSVAWCSIECLINISSNDLFHLNFIECLISFIFRNSQSAWMSSRPISGQMIKWNDSAWEITDLFEFLIWVFLIW
jgi:hypothetical protein